VTKRSIENGHPQNPTANKLNMVYIKTVTGSEQHMHTSMYQRMYYLYH